MRQQLSPKGVWKLSMTRFWRWCLFRLTIVLPRWRQMVFYFLPWWVHTPVGKSSTRLGRKGLDLELVLYLLCLGFCFLIAWITQPIRKCHLIMKSNQISYKIILQKTPLILSKPKYSNNELEIKKITNLVTLHLWELILSLEAWWGVVLAKHPDTQVNEWIR